MYIFPLSEVIWLHFNSSQSLVIKNSSHNGKPTNWSFEGVLLGYLPPLNTIDMTWIPVPETHSPLCKVWNTVQGGAHVEAVQRAPCAGSNAATSFSMSAFATSHRLSLRVIRGFICTLLANCSHTEPDLNKIPLAILRFLVSIMKQLINCHAYILSA